MRSLGKVATISRITASLVKAEACNDHGLAISADPNLLWSWAATAGAARFVFNCNVKYVYGQAASASATCGAYRTYAIDVTLASSGDDGAGVLAFEDDFCGAVTLSDALGHTASTSTAGL
jgi:hypothetical protein